MIAAIYARKSTVVGASGPAEWLGVGRLWRSRLLGQGSGPTPEIERTWRALATRRVHSIPRVGLTPAQLEALGL